MTKTDLPVVGAVLMLLCGASHAQTTSFEALVEETKALEQITLYLKSDQVYNALLTCEENLESERARAGERESKIAEMHTNEARCVSERADATNELAALRAQLNAQRTIVQDTQKRLADEQSLVRKLQAQLEVSASENTKKGEEILKLTRTIDQQDAEIEEVYQKLTDVKSEKARLADSNTALARTRDELERALITRSEALDIVKDRNAKAQAVQEHQHSEIVSLETGLGVLRAQHTDALDIIDTLKQEVQSAQSRASWMKSKAHFITQGVIENAIGPGVILDIELGTEQTDHDFTVRINAADQEKVQEFFDDVTALIDSEMTIQLIPEDRSTAQIAPDVWVLLDENTSENLQRAFYERTVRADMLAASKGMKLPSRVFCNALKSRDVLYADLWDKKILEFWIYDPGVGYGYCKLTGSANVQFHGPFPGRNDQFLAHVLLVEDT